MLFSIADARRFLAAGFFVIFLRMLSDLPTLHIKSASRVTERAAGVPPPQGAIGVGLGSRAHLFRFGANGRGGGEQHSELDMGGNEMGDSDVGGEAASGGGGGGGGRGGGGGGGVASDAGGGYLGRDAAGAGVGSGSGGGGGGGEENEMFDASQHEVDDAEAERAAAHVRAAAENIVIPTEPDDGADGAAAGGGGAGGVGAAGAVGAAAAAGGAAAGAVGAAGAGGGGRVCVVTPNCTHWLDWILMPQDILVGRCGLTPGFRR